MAPTLGRSVSTTISAPAADGVDSIDGKRARHRGEHDNSEGASRRMLDRPRGGCVRVNFVKTAPGCYTFRVDQAFGGETASTGLMKPGLHAEVPRTS